MDWPKVDGKDVSGADWADYLQCVCEDREIADCQPWFTAIAILRCADEMKARDARLRAALDGGAVEAMLNALLKDCGADGKDVCDFETFKLSVDWTSYEWKERMQAALAALREIVDG